MGVWRYCEHCGAGQDRITLEDLVAISYDENAKVSCDNCDKQRSDDTPAARTILLVREIKERDEHLGKLEGQVKILVEATRKIAKKVRS